MIVKRGGTEARLRANFLFLIASSAEVLLLPLLPFDLFTFGLFDFSKTIASSAFFVLLKVGTIKDGNPPEAPEADDFLLL